MVLTCSISIEMNVTHIHTENNRLMKNAKEKYSLLSFARMFRLFPLAFYVNSEIKAVTYTEDRHTDSEVISLIHQSRWAECIIHIYSKFKKKNFIFFFVCSLTKLVLHAIRNRNYCHTLQLLESLHLHCNFRFLF